MAFKKRVLIIDDEADFCFFVSKNLENTGEFEVLTANSAEDGIKLARQSLPDIILLDIIMPKMQGPDVAKALANDPETRYIPLIFLTAIVMENEIGNLSIKEIGGYNFIAKPANTEKLIQSIKMVLRDFSKTTT